MSIVNPWARHFQLVWEERAGNDRFPYWLRVASLAYGKHSANGHAMFKPGEIGLILAETDKATGEITPLDRQAVHRAIRTAIAYGWLSEQSGSRCLVVPGHAIEGGVKGNHWDKCPQHGKPRSVGTQRLHAVPNVGIQ